MFLESCSKSVAIWHSIHAAVKFSAFTKFAGICYFRISAMNETHELKVSILPILLKVPDPDRDSSYLLDGALRK